MTADERRKMDEMMLMMGKVIGIIQGNGGKGLGKHVEEHTTAITEIGKKMEHVQTKEGCVELQKACVTQRKEEIVSAVREALSRKGRNRWLVIKDILLAILSSSVLAAVIAAYAVLKGG